MHGPSEAVEDFAAYFDLYAEERGTAQALELVENELARRRAETTVPQYELGRAA